MLGVHARRRYINRSPRRIVAPEACVGACINVTVAKDSAGHNEWSPDNVVPTICKVPTETLAPNSCTANTSREPSHDNDASQAVDDSLVDLSQRLDEAYGKLEAAGAREQHLAEIARARSARALRLAVRLEVQRERAKQEKAAFRRRVNCKDIIVAHPPAHPPHPSAVTTSEVEDLKHEILALKECLDSVKAEAEKLGTSADFVKAIETAADVEVENAVPELPLWLQGRAPATPTLAWEKHGETDMVDSSTQTVKHIMCEGASQTCSSSVTRKDAASGPDDSVEACSQEDECVENSPSSPAAAKLAQLAAASPEVRQKLLARLRGGKLNEATVRATHDASDQSGHLASHNPSAIQVDSPPIGFATKGVQGPARNEIVERISQLSSANEELRAKMLSSEAETGLVRRELIALRDAAEIRERELSRARADSRIWERKAAEATEEFQEEIRRNAARSARENSGPTIHGPGIKLNWAAAWEWPGGTASSRGMDQLRKSMDGREAKLEVGPPPADWRVWMQIGLRRRQPAEPALLRLAVDGAEGEAYTGLIWPAWMT